MPPLRPGRQRAVVPALAAALLALVAALVVLTGVASADTTTKPYSVSLSPQAAPAGTQPTLTLTVTNLANPQALGSMNITVPAALQPVALTGPANPNRTVAGNVIRLRNMNLAPGAATSVSFSVRVPCTPSNPFAFTVAAKQSNDFNGTGNDFVLTGPAPALSGTGTCSLAFGTSPADAQRATDITGDIFLPFGGTTAPRPVTVRVLDGTGTGLVTWWSTPVTLAIRTGTGAPGATLTGGSAVPSGGVAVFGSATTPGPRISTSFPDYVLRATSTGSTTATSITSPAPSSAPFDIVDSGQRCRVNGTRCTGATSGATTTAAASALPLFADDILIVNLEGAANPAPKIDCPNYVETRDQVFIDMTRSDGLTPSGDTKSITYTVLNATRPASQYGLCFAAPYVFATDGGVPLVQLVDGPVTYNVGLLPLCRSVGGVAPCLDARPQRSGTSVVITAIAPALDPRIRA